VRVLDLGCGAGKRLALWKVSPPDEVTGIDIKRTYLEAAVEDLPFPNESFDRIVSSVALPYMNIPKALAEIYRVLKSAGSVGLSLHPLSFTLKELRDAFPHPAAILFRCYVLANGLCFHFSGWSPGESFQTKRGMRLAMKRAGFVLMQFRTQSTPQGERFIVEAMKP
jgi:ubiquinone/menaquinone biosynthesis C-methylase UbiE